MVNGVNTKLNFHVDVHPGARIGSLMDAVQLASTKANGSTYDLIVVFAGICNITSITYMPYRAAILKNNSVDTILEMFEEECNRMEGVQSAIPVLFTPIVGIDLIHYAGHWNNTLFEMQPLVDKVTMMINDVIRRINNSKGLPTPNTSSCIHRCRGRDKGYRTHYQKLYDGCHPTEQVKIVWANAIADSCQKILLSF